MDIDENPSNHNTANGFTNHGTVNSSNNSVSNGHSQSNEANHHSSTSNGCKKKTNETLDGMEDEEYTDANHSTDMETTQSADVQKKCSIKDENQLLIRILQFGRELHALKQQLTVEHGDNQQHDKMLQVRIDLFDDEYHTQTFDCLQDAFSLLAYSDPKSSPLAHLLEPSQREAVSSAVNSAILGMLDFLFLPDRSILLNYSFSFLFRGT